MTIKLSKPFLKDSIQSILIIGLGESGFAMAKWCLLQGAKVRLADTRTSNDLSEQQQTGLTDLKKLGLSDIHLGDWSERHADEIDNLLNQIDIIGISPGLSPLSEPTKTILALAKQKAIPVWSEIEFFANAIKAIEGYKPQVLAITGTNGKTTTTALTGQICTRAGKQVAVAGNISPAALEKMIAVLDEAQDVSELPEIWVLELSSFQLEFTHTLNPHAAALLNISQDHLDWHGDMQSYVTAKAKIIGINSDIVINRDDVTLQEFMLTDSFSSQRVIRFGNDAPQEPNSFGIERDPHGGIDWLVWAEPDEATTAAEANPEQFTKRRNRKKSQAYQRSDELRIKRLIPVDALRIRGRHNALNALAALALAKSAGLNLSLLLHGLREYRGEPHRVQSIAMINDVEYIDDSKGTNVGATVAALESLGSEKSHKQIWLIVGGDGKGQDFQPLRSPIQRYVKGLFLIGRDADIIKAVCAQELDPSVSCEKVDTLEEVVKKVAQQARSGDIVLLSPACASFDMFRNYEHRATVFAEAVHELAFTMPTLDLGATA